MARTVVALYDNFQNANDAVRELVDKGFRRENISFMANDKTGEYGRALQETNVTTYNAAGANTGAGVGAGIGAAVGGLAGVLIGLGALAIPGIGPVLAAGPLATVLAGLAGAGAGAIAGGVLGALVDMGIPEETAGYYAEGVRRGGTLVTVQAEDYQTDQAVDILNRHDPVDLNERVATWRQSGWTGYQGGEIQPNMGTTPHDRERLRAQDYGYYDTGFRDYFNTTPYASSATYEDYQPAYRYGYDLASNPQYQGRTWKDIEPEAQRNWETTHQGAWDKFKDSVEHAWNAVTGQNQTNTTMNTGTNKINTFNVSDTGTGNVSNDYMVYDTNFRQHFSSSPYASNYSYTDFQPAYRYGYDLARNPMYQGSSWSAIEPQVRHDWESQGHQGTWDQVKGAVQYAWQQVKQAVS